MDDGPPASRPPPPRVGPSAGEYLAAPNAYPGVARRPNPLDAPPLRPMVRRSPIEAPLPQSFPVGPGGVTGAPEGPPAPNSLSGNPALYEREMARAVSGAHEGAQLASAHRVQPLYRHGDAQTEALRRDFGGTLPPIGPGGIVGGSSVSRASGETGVAQGYLDALIGHESGGDDYAKAPTSSAEGAGQFTKGTWLRMMNQHGPAYGLPRNLPESALLALRNNRDWSALMTAEYARENERAMSQALRRPITQREAYLGHFLGGDQAADLIAAAEHGLPDARRFVSAGAVRDNPQIFFEGGRYEWRSHPQTGQRYQHYVGGGRPRSAQEVVRLQGRNFSSDALTAGR